MLILALDQSRKSQTHCSFPRGERTDRMVKPMGEPEQEYHLPVLDGFPPRVLR